MTEHGGKVLGEPFDADDAARMVNLQDPEGVKFSAWQPTKPEQDATLYNENRAHCWTELATNSSGTAKEFYGKVLNWDFRPFDGSPMAYDVIGIPGSEETFGGMFEITADMGGMPPQWIPYFMVSDIEASVKKAVDLAGTSHGVMDIGQVGKIAMLQDAEKAGFALIQPRM